MVILAVAVVVGMGAAASLPALPDPHWLQWLPIAVLIAVFNPRARPLLVAVAAGLAMLGQGALTLKAAHGTGEVMRDARLAGCVTGIPVRRGDSVRFWFKTLRRDGHRLVIPPRVALAWYRQQALPSPGECMTLTARTRWPRARFNDGGLDYPRWLYTHGIARQGYVRAGSAVRSGPGPEFVGGSLDRWRLRIGERMADALGTGAGAGLVRALVLGLRDGVDEATRETLRATGTAHLLAVSGLHIGLVCMAAFCVARWLAARVQRRLPAFRVAALVAFAASVTYAMLAGLSLPTQRALVLAAVMLAAHHASAISSPARSLALAAVVLLVLDPSAALATGTWLSFGAVAMLLHGLRGAPPAASAGMTLVRAQWVATIGLAPLVVALFDRLPVLGIPANLVAVPVAAWVAVPLALLGTLGLMLAEPLGTALLWMAAAVLEALLWVLRAFEANGAGMVPRSLATPLTLALAAAGVALALAHRAVPSRWLAPLLCAPLFFHAPPRPLHGRAEVSTLSVGQGLATVVLTRHHTLVYDTGPAFAGFSAAEAAVLPALRRAGRSRIDRLVVSHADADHAAGAGVLMSLMPVAEIVGAPREPLAAHAIPCPRRLRWRWDGVDFELARPPLARASRNNGSCILRVVAGGQAMLLTGDIEARAERALIDGPYRLRADVLVAPHHGSQTSSTPAFISAVSPAHVIFPVGEGNRFGFPHPQVVRRYRGRGVALWDTAHHGAVTVRLGGPGPVQVDAAAPRMMRFWHRRAALPRDGPNRTRPR